MVQNLKLSRAQLASFLNDAESIKQFEKLFAVADDVQATGGGDTYVDIPVASAATITATLTKITAQLEAIATDYPGGDRAWAKKELNDILTRLEALETEYPGSTKAWVKAQKFLISVVGTALTSAYFWVGSGTNVAAAVTMSGDATMTNAGLVSVNKTRLSVRNETGASIATTKAVYVSGFNNLPLISLADNTNEAKHNVVGITVGAIAHQANGYIATGGQCDAETNSWNVGDELYFTTAGGLVNSEPTSGEVKHVGIVTVKQNYPAGKILIYSQFEGAVRGVGAASGIIDRLGDDIGATVWSLRNYSNTEVAKIDSLGAMTVTRMKSTGIVAPGSYTVGTLPVGGAAGDRATATDALAPVFGAAVVAGGAVVVPVYYDGAVWKVG